MVRTILRALVIAMGIAAAALPVHGASIGGSLAVSGPTRVQFDSADGQSALIGFLYVPTGSGPFPAVVMLHGRSGLYSTRAGSIVSAESLSARHRYWAGSLARAGYVTLLVDSFSSRGYPAGFARGTYSQRPLAVSDQTVRPLDAFGAATFLRQRPDVIADRIGLFGWSNGAMSVLALFTGVVPPPANGPSDGASAPAMDAALGAAAAGKGPSGAGFRAAIAFYPGCVVPQRQRAVPNIPLLLLIAGEDDEVSPQRCVRWAEAVADAAPGFAWHLLPGAAHNFDGLALGSRASPADMAAAIRAEAMVKAFLAQHLGADAAGAGAPQ